MGPGDRPAPGEGPGCDIPPDVSEGVDIYWTAGSIPDSFKGGEGNKGVLPFIVKARCLILQPARHLVATAPDPDQQRLAVMGDG
ncbi:hypothetical protein EYF80_049924 [Liparis tanakae]|uniref:Uncharacterized protein n=1 Tax=Liparis tanakae TaxID=230148 RepID=A0A4Z2FFF9_9TELE|nr:hypothetical protein EYF80_049924 [Liparis tanakae]